MHPPSTDCTACRRWDRYPPAHRDCRRSRSRSHYSAQESGRRIRAHDQRFGADHDQRRGGRARQFKLDTGRSCPRDCSPSATSASGRSRADGGRRKKLTAREPRISRAVRSTCPRLSKARWKTLFLCHRRGDRDCGRIPHPDIAQQMLFNASQSGSIKSSKPRTQMQNVMLFQHPAKALLSTISGPSWGFVGLNVVSGCNS